MKIRFQEGKTFICGTGQKRHRSSPVTLSVLYLRIDHSIGSSWTTPHQIQQDSISNVGPLKNICIRNCQEETTLWAISFSNHSGFIQVSAGKHTIRSAWKAHNGQGKLQLTKRFWGTNVTWDWHTRGENWAAVRFSSTMPDIEAKEDKSLEERKMKSWQTNWTKKLDVLFIAPCCCALGVEDELDTTLSSGMKMNFCLMMSLRWFQTLAS